MALVLAASLSALSALDSAGIRFRDIASEAGLTAETVCGSPETTTYILETLGTGVALFDYDNDGWLDAFLVNSSRLAGFPAGEEPTNKLYRNLGDGTFEDVTAQLGLERSGWGVGVCGGDYNNDGFVDLFVTYFGSNVLYRNETGRSFTDVSEEAGLAAPGRRWGTGCAFLDYDKDGKLDLFVAHYVDLDLSVTPKPGETPDCLWKGIPVMCGPRGLPGGQNALYHNEGGGKFRDVSKASGVAEPDENYALTVLTADFDGDGWTDVYVANDSKPSLLYQNQGDGTFAEVGLIAGVALNEDGKEQAGMGAAAGDFDRDGFPDILKSNFSDDVPNLYRNQGDGSFTDLVYSAGLGTHSSYLGWGVAFIDVDQDGWKDIFIANGHVYPEVDRHALNTSYRQSKLLFRNLGNKKFADVTALAGDGITAKRPARGVAWGDFDNDGSLEILVSNVNERPTLLKNFGKTGNAVLLRLEGVRSNRDGIGAKIVISAGGARQSDEVRSGGGYVSQSDFRVHFGLGEADKVERIEVRWPSGVTDVVVDQPANHILHIREGQGVTAKKEFAARR